MWDLHAAATASDQQFRRHRAGSTATAFTQAADKEVNLRKNPYVDEQWGWVSGTGGLTAKVNV